MCVPTALVPLEWQAEEVCNGSVIWTCDFCVCKKRPPARTFESARCLVRRTLPTLTPNLQTNVRSSSVDRRWASQRSRNSFVMQSCNMFTTEFLSLCHRSCSHVQHQPSSFLQANVMSHDPDSVNVNRLWSGSPQPSGDFNIIGCFMVYGDQSASMKSRGEVVRRPVSYHGVPWRAWCGNLSTLME